MMGMVVLMVTGAMTKDVVARVKMTMEYAKAMEPVEQWAVMQRVKETAKVMEPVEQ
jgi:hypothetical protein